ncbi:MAG: IS66 family transposase, partial [Bacillota bacterium]
MNKIIKLDQEIEQLNDKVLSLEQQNAELNARLKWYEEQFRLSRQKQYGASSEKTNPEQLSLFNEAEDIANPKLEEA